MYLQATARLALYVQGGFGSGKAKTAEGILRYGTHSIAAVVDKSNRGRDLQAVAGIANTAPIVESVADAAQLKANTLVIGTTNFGGTLDSAARKAIIEALNLKLDIVNGMHEFLNDDAQIARLAKEKGCRLLDVRRPPADLPLASGKCLQMSAHRSLTVGTDASIGKMTTSMALLAECKARNLRANFIATGQTGIMIAGQGICIDAVLGDFMAGAVEQMVLAVESESDFILVEGQGAIAHPGFSGVTLALIHGCCPQTMVLCHQFTRKTMKNLPYPVPTLLESISAYEHMASLLGPSKVVAISLDTRGLSDREARLALQEASELTSLPTNDPVRFGVANILDAIIAHR
jgi:uncharacterized NAD-dependent epimerase/dehydratase family protein